MLRLALVLLVLTTAHLRAGPAAVADLVRQLGHDRFAVREAAQAELLRRGEDVVPDLDRAARGADAETAERVRKIRYALVGYLADVERLLADVDNRPDYDPDAIAPELRGLIESHQPRAADLLLTFATDPKHPLQLRAMRAFLQTWESASAAQLDRFIQTRVYLTTTHRPKFPAKAGGMVPMAVVIRHGWNAWFPISGPHAFAMTNRTTRYLDGQPYEKPFPHAHPFATVGWYRTGELAIGKHTIHAVLEYEFTHKGVKRTGTVRSADSTFEVIAADTPDDLVAPKSEALTKEVRTAFRLRETEHAAAIDGLPRVPEVPDESDYWRPQVTWSTGGKDAGIHCPIWGLARPLDVDLCFAVEIHDLKTGKVHPADPVVVHRGRSTRGYIVPRDARAFAADRDGFVAVKVVLTPSRGLALTDPDVVKYYPEPIATSELRMKVFADLKPRPPSK